MNITNRFPILSFTSRLLRIIGFLIVVGAVLYWLAAAIIEPMLPNHAFGSGDFVDALVALAGVIAGLLLVIVGECIGVLFAIEANTRAAAERLQLPSTQP